MNTFLSQNLWSFVWQFLKPYKRIVVIYVCLAVLAGCWSPFNSMLIKYMINSLSSSQIENISLLTWPAVLLVLNFVVFDNFTWRSIGYLNYKFQPVIKNQIISESFRFVLGSSHQFFHDNLSGRISNQINTLADNIERILHRISPDFIRGFSVLMVAFVSMYYVNPKFFYTLVLWFIAFSSFSIYMSKQLVNLSDAYTDSESEISGQLVDSITNVSNVGIFARCIYEVLRLENSLRVTKEKFQKKEIFLVKLHSVQGMLIAIMLGFMIYFLIQLYGSHLISVGDFALILGLSMEVAHITWYTMSQVDEFNQAVGKCKQSLACLIVPQDIKDQKDAPNLLITKGQITFSNVKFHYKGTEPLFQNKSVTIEAGQKVGLVGYSGGGKSTFVNLILRLYDVTDGHILIDGQSIRDVTQDSLRKHIAMIPQDPSLFHRTLMENIRYGRIEATDDEVIEAAKKAHAHEFISQLPQGYESPVGERGIKLSGGQRQRIAIARAILKNAPILILDEATSQLDSVTESDIQESLWQLMQDKTTIIIAHRLSTLLHMDRIIVFDQGKIVEDGTHTELLKHGGLYKTLWDAQVGGFLPDKKAEDAVYS
jgi:ATP-binding cassette, subfamily B, bacterial